MTIIWLRLNELDNNNDNWSDIRFVEVKILTVTCYQNVLHMYYVLYVGQHWSMFKEILI